MKGITLTGIFLLATFEQLHDADCLRFPGFFIPEEVQTILSIFYSHLPPTKIGSDKRFGVGFRLGNNADAQILIELGPQSETQPLGNIGDGLSKRENKIDRDNITNDQQNRSLRRQTYKSKPIRNDNINQNFGKLNDTEEEHEIDLHKGTVSKTSQSNTNEPNSTSNKGKKPIRRQKKVKSVSEKLVLHSTSVQNKMSHSNHSQAKPETFLNNFMTWLNTYNIKRDNSVKA